VKAFSSTGALGRLGSRGLTRDFRARLEVPPSLWPMAWHATAVVALLIALSIAGYLVHRSHRMQYLQAMDTLKSAQQDLERLRQSPPADPISSIRLAEASTVDDILRDFGEFGKANAVTMGAVTIERDVEAAPEFNQIRITAKASGEYIRLKSWLTELLARYPSLVLSTLSLRRTAPDSSQVEATLSLSLYLKGRR